MGRTGNCKSLNDYVNMHLRVVFFLLHFRELRDRLLPVKYL